VKAFAPNARLAQQVDDPRGLPAHISPFFSRFPCHRSLAMRTSQVVFSFFRYHRSHVHKAFILMGFQSWVAGRQVPPGALRLLGCGSGNILDRAGPDALLSDERPGPAR